MEGFLQQNCYECDKRLDKCECEEKTQKGANKKVPNNLQEKSRSDSTKLNDIKDRKDVI